jgi:tRNA-dihydrouridine synthase
MSNFWQKLPKPFFAFAPMEDVTDTVFRQIVADCARPDVFFTEFVSVDGMFSRGREKVIQRFKFTEAE